MSRNRAVLVVSWRQLDDANEALGKLARIADGIRAHLEDAEGVLIHVAIDGPADAVLDVFDPTTKDE